MTTTNKTYTKQDTNQQQYNKQKTNTNKLNDNKTPTAHTLKITQINNTHD